MSANIEMFLLTRFVQKWGLEISSAISEFAFIFGPYQKRLHSYSRMLKTDTFWVHFLWSFLEKNVSFLRIVSVFSIFPVHKFWLTFWSFGNIYPRMLFTGFTIRLKTTKFRQKFDQIRQKSTKIGPNWTKIRPKFEKFEKMCHFYACQR